MLEDHTLGPPSPPSPPKKKCISRVRNCAFLVANVTKNFALATRISQLVAQIFSLGDWKKGQSPVGTYLKKLISDPDFTAAVLLNRSLASELNIILFFLAVIDSQLWHVSESNITRLSNYTRCIWELDEISWGENLQNFKGILSNW